MYTNPRSRYSVPMLPLLPVDTRTYATFVVICYLLSSLSQMSSSSLPTSINDKSPTVSGLRTVYRFPRGVAPIAGCLRTTSTALVLPLRASANLTLYHKSRCRRSEMGMYSLHHLYGSFTIYSTGKTLPAY